MDAHTLNTQARTGTGKGNARQLRRGGLIPAVFYGPSADTTSLQVSPKELTDALSTVYGRNQLLKLDVGGQERLALVKELQVHPLTRAPLHVDFYSVTPESVVECEVPLTTTGRPKGVVAGGELRVMFRSLPLRGAPGAFPAVVNIEVDDLELGDAVKVEDITLEPGVVISLAADRTVVAVMTIRHRGGGEDDEETDAVADAAGESPAAAAGAADSK